MNRKRMKKFAEFLRTIPPRKFNMNIIHNIQDLYLSSSELSSNIPLKECDFAGCAIGWLPACFPRLVGYETDQKLWNYSDVILKNGSNAYGVGIFEELFDIDEDMAMCICLPETYKSKNITPIQVSRRIEAILDGKFTKNDAERCILISGI